NVVSIAFHYRGSDARAGRRIGQTGVTSPVGLGGVSTGMDDGGGAVIAVDGDQRAPNRPGYNVVAIDRAGGEVLWSDAFDTAGSPAESLRLAAAIDRLAAGTIVVGAVRGEAST